MVICERNINSRSLKTQKNYGKKETLKYIETYFQLRKKILLSIFQ